MEYILHFLSLKRIKLPIQTTNSQEINVRLLITEVSRYNNNRLMISSNLCNCDVIWCRLLKIVLLFLQFLTVTHTSYFNFYCRISDSMVKLSTHVPDIYLHNWEVYFISDFILQSRDLNGWCLESPLLVVWLRNWGNMQRRWSSWYLPLPVRKSSLIVIPRVTLLTIRVADTRTLEHHRWIYFSKNGTLMRTFVKWNRKHGAKKINAVTLL